MSTNSGDDRAPTTETAGNAMGVKWKDVGILPCRPSLFEVRGSREEISLLFGQIQDTRDENQFYPVSTRRIILNPALAKRLAMSLQKCISSHESRYGPIGRNHRTAAQEDPLKSAAPNGMKKPNEIAAELFELVRAIRVDTVMEHSFKMRHGTLLPDRFLLGIDKQDLGEMAYEKVLNVCTGMGMPDGLLTSFQRRFSEANYVHFGFENSGKTIISKTYLEFYDRVERGLKERFDGKPGPSVLYRGYKWDPRERTGGVETTYRWHPWLSTSEMEERMERILSASRNGKCLEIIRAVLKLASRRVSHQDILYMDVAEKGNPRRSFDINFYRAGFQMGELYPYFCELCQCYSIHPGSFHDLYHPAETQIFGHLSGGMDRNNLDFFTIYHRPKNLPEPAFPSLRSGRKPAARPGKSITPQPIKNHLHQGIETRDEKAALLFHLVHNLGINVGMERSFKVFKETLLKDRFLMGIRRSDLGNDVEEPIMEICRRLNMPGDFVKTFRSHLAESTIVLFGFEAGEERAIYKAYLEFGGRFAAASERNPSKPEPFPMHLAFKWDPIDHSYRTTTDYICFPALTIPDILKQVATSFYPHGGIDGCFGIVENMIQLVSVRSGLDGTIYFESHEPGNPRHSFDINVYLADLRIREIYPLLTDMARHYDIPDKSFDDLYGTIRSLIFGHFTGGIDRRGRDFLTVYYGEKGSSSLRTGT